MQAIYTLGLLGSLLLGQAKATSGFSNTCDEIYVDADSVEAKCEPQTPMGPPWICSKLDLNLCLGVQYGHLIAQDNGRYSEWCGTCGEVDSRIFACQCWTGTYHGDGQPVYQYTEFDLDTIVGNDFGYLRCFDNIAPKSYGCV